MPKDIRSYFIPSTSTKNGTCHSTSKVKKRTVISSDEEEAKSCLPAKRSKITKKPIKHHVLSDSDDDVTTADTCSKLSTTKDKKLQKTVSPLNMFGKKPIERIDGPKISRKLQKMEAEFHNNDSFETMLRQLDMSNLDQVDPVNNSKKQDNNEDKNIHWPKKPRLEDTNNKKKEKFVKNNEIREEIHTSNTNLSEKMVKATHKNYGKEKKITSSTSSNEDVHISHKESNNTMSKKMKFNKSKKGSVSNSILEVEIKKPDEKESPSKVSVDIYEERIQKKKQNVALYQQYLQRGGARNPGSKQVPEGAENCLAGLNFVITGVMDSLEREEAEELIKKYNGRILQQVSKKIDYIIIGDQPGPSKLLKADNLSIKKISEDDLLELIRTRPAGKVEDVKQFRGKSKEKGKEISLLSGNSTSSLLKEIETNTREKSKSPIKTQSPIKQEISYNLQESMPLTENKITSNAKKKDTDLREALVEKYRPKTLKQIIGQQGDKSNAKKLYAWLVNWHKNQNKQVKHVRPNPWDKNHDGAIFKAALLSGPPGVGKTTTIQVVCKELGMDLLEFNASDTRSKKLLQEQVSEILHNSTMTDYFKDQKVQKITKHVLLMDEVDGMAGNEDRGGLQELIALIKATNVPIICICNDRNHPKMRTLSNYTFDLKFQKPRLEQIRGAMRSICFKESIDISQNELDQLIESTNQDIRQTINHLALLTAKPNFDKNIEKEHVQSKNIRLGPWDVVRKVFSAEEHKNMNIHDKSHLFFHDYNIAPLFVQENYLSVRPNAPKNELLDRIARSAESLALGDVVDKNIRSSGAWNLLPLQACFSSVIPGTAMSGHIVGQITFPSWLGRNSTRNKFDRLIQGITLHARLTTGASKEAINLDYLKHLRNAIVRPLMINDIEAAVNVMNQYYLLREDLDSLIEVSLWPRDSNPMQALDSKVKTAFTKAYNKSSLAMPYSISTMKKKSQNLQDDNFIKEETDDEINSEGEDDALDMDKMVKIKKPTKKNTESVSKNKEKTTKHGRGRGKAK